MYWAIKLYTELTRGGSWVHPYSYNGKLWGGPGPGTTKGTGGLDCTGFLLGAHRRLGLLPYASLEPLTEWRHMSANFYREHADAVSEAAVRPFDVAVWDGHVALVIEPGSLLMDAGGGGRSTNPEGADWPPTRGCVRFLPWSYWSSERLGYVKAIQLATSAADESINERWQNHVDGAPLGAELGAWFRDVNAAPDVRVPRAAAWKV